MLMSHHQMVKHEKIKTWCTTNPTQSTITYIASSHQLSLYTIDQARNSKGILGMAK